MSECEERTPKEEERQGPVPVTGQPDLPCLLHLCRLRAHIPAQKPLFGEQQLTVAVAAEQGLAVRGGGDRRRPERPINSSRTSR